MWKDSFKIPPPQKTFNGEVFTTISTTIEVTKQNAQKTAEFFKARGYRVRIVKFAYHPRIGYGYVLYGKHTGKSKKK